MTQVANLPLVPMIPAEKLPLVSLSTTPAANFATRFNSFVDTGVNDTDGKQWEQYQAADTLK
jgi:hypothetical protein